MQAHLNAYPKRLQRFLFPKVAPTCNQISPAIALCTCIMMWGVALKTLVSGRDTPAVALPGMRRRR